MKKPNATRLQGLLGVLAAAVIPTLSSQAADLVAGWDFEQVEADGVSIKSVIGPFVGEISEFAVLTEPGGGAPREGGGRGFDVSSFSPGWLVLEAEGNDNPMNRAAENDQVTIVLWQKNYSNINSSSFWGVGETTDRAFQFHVPWSDGTIYFDTSGGCCGANIRQNRNVEEAFPGFDWLEWHHYAFVKDGPYKAIYIDGQLLVEGEGFDPLPTDFIRFTIGGQDRSSPPDAIIDDFAIFRGILSSAEIADLAAGGDPFVPPLDTDGDGMPDSWEIRYGFNPNDPSDAAQDADNDGATNLEEYLAGTDPADNTPPTLTSTTGTSSLDQIILTFSEALDPVSAEDVSNYSISPDLAITAASYNRGVVTLTTAAQTPGATLYTVTIGDVQDTSKNPAPENTTGTFYSYLLTKTGVLKFSFWGNISGTPIDNLLFDERYPASPDWIGAVFSLNSRDIFPTDATDNYGATIEGYLTPAESGDYHFFLRSDDASELYISSNDSEANLALQAYEYGCCNAFQEPGADQTTAVPLSLVAGNRYFIRVIYKEGGGGDFAQVAWRKTTSTTPAALLQPIPGTFLSAAVDLPAPPEGAFLRQTPAAGAQNVLPNTRVVVAHRDGKTELTSANVSLKINGVAVTPVFTKEGNVLTVDYASPALYASGSTQTATLTYLDAGGQPATNEWSFTVLAYHGSTEDTVADRPALITGNATYTADGGGKSGQAGDYAIDHTLTGGALINLDASWANVGTANDELSVVFWQKKYDTAASSGFWFNSPQSLDTARGFQAHVPWSDGNIYYDTGGASATAVPPTRINAHIDTFSTEEGFWTNSWHHLAFTKKGGHKQIWIDGQLFLEGFDSAPLQADFTSLFIGSDGSGGGLSHALIDDFAVFSTQLVQADVAALTGGTLPSALPAGKGLLAYWDFNDAAVAGPTISIAGSIITYTGTLQSASTLDGTFAPVAGASSPYTIPAEGSGDLIFYRSAE